MCGAQYGSRDVQVFHKVNPENLCAMSPRSSYFQAQLIDVYKRSFAQSQTIDTKTFKECFQIYKHPISLLNVFCMRKFTMEK